MTRTLWRAISLLAVVWATFGHVLPQDSRLPQNIIEEYERARQNGEALGAFQHYNVGQAYKAQNQLGKALAHLLHAWELSPRDARIARAIHELYSTTEQNVQEQSPLFAILRSVQSVLSFAEQSIASFLIWCGCFAAFAVAHEQRRTLRRVAVATALLVLGLLISRDIVENAYPQYVVVVPQAFVHTGASEDYLAMFALPEATPLRLIATRDDWALVQLLDTRQGWLLTRHIFPVRP